jgi:hypothetical protein
MKTSIYENQTLEWTGMFKCSECGGDGKHAELRLDVQGDGVWLYVKSPTGIRGAVALDHLASPLVRQALLDIAALPEQRHDCTACEGDGEREMTCELRFDIDPGTPATGFSGPPENYDPGEGPTVHKLAAFINGEDVTKRMANPEAADEFICENWSDGVPDYGGEPDYDPEDL